MDITGKYDVILIVIVLMLNFLSCNSCNGNTTYTGKTVNFRHRMNHHITACR